MSKEEKTWANLIITSQQTIHRRISVVITHAGSGALFNSIKSGKKIIAMARLHEYNEMADNHQQELLSKLVEGGYVPDGTYSFEEAWNKLDSFTPRPNDFENHIVETIDGWIREWMK